MSEAASHTSSSESTPTLLATTALESTWGHAEPILFLGEWCKSYVRRDVWQARIHDTVPFHWDDRTKLASDYDYLESLHGRLLKGLALGLNELHGVDHSLRYWQTLLDPWLMSYVGVAFDRWENLRLAFGMRSSLSTVVLNDASSEPAFSYAEWISLVLSDEWNHSFCRRIVESEYANRCHVRSSDAPPIDFPRVRHLARTRRIARRLDWLVGKATPPPSVVFINPYFGWLPFIKLNLALRQVPRLFLEEFDPNPEIVSASTAIGRDDLRMTLEPRSGFESFLLGEIKNDLPRCVVESYSALRARAQSLMLHPRVIMTANDHWSNACTKAWIAERSSQNVPFIVIEHGGSLATYKTTFNFEEDISDKKCTWFLPHHQKHVQLPPSKLIGRHATSRVWWTPKPLRRFCSVIGSEQPRWVVRAHFYPMAAQCLESLEMTVGMYEALSPDVQASLRVKPHYTNHWHVRERLVDRLGAVHVLPDMHIDRVFERSRLIVCTYPETTFSEAMASGIPTIIVYPPQLYELHSISHPLADLLRSARIVFHDPHSAATHINSVWKDPASWWRSREVTFARAEFARQALDLQGSWLKKWSTFVDTLVD